jgi:hypothetical protein
MSYGCRNKCGMAKMSLIIQTTITATPDLFGDGDVGVTIQATPTPADAAGYFL